MKHFNFLLSPIIVTCSNTFTHQVSDTSGLLTESHLDKKLSSFSCIANLKNTSAFQLSGLRELATYLIIIVGVNSSMRNERFSYMLHST